MHASCMAKWIRVRPTLLAGCVQWVGLGPRVPRTQRSPRSAREEEPCESQGPTNPSLPCLQSTRPVVKVPPTDVAKYGRRAPSCRWARVGWGACTRPRTYLPRRVPIDVSRPTLLHLAINAIKCDALGFVFVFLRANFCITTLCTPSVCERRRSGIRVIKL